MPQIAPPLKSAMYSALAQQLLILSLAGLILDGGMLAQICFYAFTAFWGGVGVLLWRRAASPTKLDLALVQGGYLLVCIISFFLSQAIWEIRGY